MPAGEARRLAPPVGRLTRPAEFQAAMSGNAGGRRIARSTHFELFAAAVAVDVANASGPRLGLAVSRKAAPLAVTRNLVKRIARESARAAPALPARDLVVRARPGLGPVWQAAKAAKTTHDFRRALRTELDALFADAARMPGRR